jgi:predicted MarR family transcription regulator
MRYELGKAIVEVADSPLRIGCVVAGCGVIAGVFEYAIHTAAESYNASAFVHALVDASLVSVSASLVVLLVLLSARERRKRVLDDVRRIAELNHHVRNALQVVVHSQYVPPSNDQRKAVLESADRIEKTLRELFPVIGER